jgi:hypothetical protein
MPSARTAWAQDGGVPLGALTVATEQRVLHGKIVQ